MLPNPDIFGPASLTVTQSISAFTTFLPKFSEIRKMNPQDNPDFAADVRMGEVAACTLTFGVAVMASSLTGSSVPAIVGVLMCLTLVTLYECTLRAYRPMEPKGLTIESAQLTKES